MAREDTAAAPERMGIAGSEAGHSRSSAVEKEGTVAVRRNANDEEEEEEERRVPPDPSSASSPNGDRIAPTTSRPEKDGGGRGWWGWWGWGGRCPSGAS